MKPLNLWAGALAVLIALTCDPGHAAERKPLVIGSGGQQQQIQATDTLKLPAATTANASINIPHGTAPSSPNNGDCWTTTSGLYCRINSATVGPFSAGSGTPGGSSGQIQYNNAGAFGGFTMAGDCTLSQPNITCSQAAKWTTARTLSFTGDVTGSGSVDGSAGVATALTIGAHKVTLGDIAQSGANTMLGNWTGSTADVAANAMPSCADTGGNHLNYISGTGVTCGTSGATSGTVTTTGSPASGNLTKFSGSTSVTNGDLSGDVTTSGTLATTIANDAVTYAKLQNVSAASKLLGRGDSGSGDAQEITLGTNLTMTGTTLSAAVTSSDIGDYSTGTWTPALTFGGGATGLTYGVQLGRYVKLGKMVFCTMNITLTNKGSSTGNAVIAGLPFAANTTTNQYQVTMAGSSNTAGLNGWAGFVAQYGGVSSTSMLVGSLLEAALTNTAFANTTRITANFVYMTD